jgi:hypothetical protein
MKAPRSALWFSLGPASTLSLEFRTVTREWQVPSGEFVFEAERDAGVRVAEVLRAQTAAVQEAIRADIVAGVRPYASDGGFRLPFAAHIVAISVP